MAFLQAGPPTITPARTPAFAASGVTADVLRLDLLHPVVSGNKWFKAKYYFAEAIAAGRRGVITFGGLWSNHVYAVAFLAREAGLAALGFLRGDPQEFAADHPARARLAALGMACEFLPREAWRRKDDPAFLHVLASEYPGYAVIPEGGAGAPGVRGAGDILANGIGAGYTHIACAVGTGTMFAGLLNAGLPGQSLTGVCVLKGYSGLAPLDGRLLRDPASLARATIFHDFHFGGYARKTEALIGFMNRFYAETLLPTDFVYTAKLCFAVEELSRQGWFPRGSRVLIVHSGGLAGNESLPPGSLLF